MLLEHGDNSDDEVNRLQPGGNYGWPFISGYKDNQGITVLQLVCRRELPRSDI